MILDILGSSVGEARCLVLAPYSRCTSDRIYECWSLLGIFHESLCCIKSHALLNSIAASPLIEVVDSVVIGLYTNCSHICRLYRQSRGSEKHAPGRCNGYKALGGYHLYPYCLTL